MEFEFVQRSPAPEQSDDFQQRPSTYNGPPEFVERPPGAGEPAAPPNRAALDDRAEVNKVLACYGVEPEEKVSAPRRETENQHRRVVVDPWGR